VTAISGEAEAAYLRTPRAIRERAEQVYALGLAGDLETFIVEEAELVPLARRVAHITRTAHPDPRSIPYHSRWRHFGAGGVDRLRPLDDLLRALPAEERLTARCDLAIVSVLLDAGAGEAWSFREPDTDRVLSRSEGLAVASYHWFVSGGLSADSGAPLCADADVLARAEEEDVARALQVAPDNPLVGVSGRAAILRRLGEVVRADPRHFGGGRPRPGRIANQLLSQAAGGELPAERILRAVLDAFGPIWPGRSAIGDVPLGDVFRHPRIGWIPFHKLSQWLTYSLCEPLEAAGIRISGMNELTGLAEYRNGGLFIDGGVLRARRDDVVLGTHRVDSDVVIEWRALTIALLDRIALEVRRELGVTAEELPLAKVLEGGTWRAGRVLASERRAGGGPPIRVDSDGTVF
jgi:hypothetical protein